VRKKNILFVIFLLLMVNNFSFSATIDVVEVKGNKRISSDRILDYAIKAGNEFDLKSIDSSLKKMYDSGLFIDIKVDLRVDGENLVLTYMVKEKPFVKSIFFEGNKRIQDEDLLSELTFAAGDTFAIGSVEESIKAVIKAYEEKKHYAVKVTYDLEERENNNIDIVFTVDEGLEAKIYNLSFYGVSAFTEKELKKVIETKKKGFFSWLTGSGKLRRDELLFDRDRIRNEYLNKGYLHAEVGEPEISLNEEKNKLSVIFRVKEGDQYKIAGINFEGNIHRTDEELRKIILSKEGDIFSSERFRNDIDYLTVAFTSIGYAFANVEPRTYIDEKELKMKISFLIEENVLVYIDRITIEGNTKTRDRVIRRELDVVEGEKYNSLKIKSSRRHLENSDFFEEINLVEDRVGDNLINLDFKIKEKSTGTFTIGAGYSTLDGVVGLFQIMQRNLFGYGYRLSMRGEIGTRRSDYVLSFTNPWLFDKPITLGFDVYKLESDYFDYDEDVTGIALRMGHPIIKRKLYMYYKLAYETLDVSDIEDNASKYLKEQEGKTTTISFTPSIVWSTLNHPLDPSEGNKSKLYLQYAGGPLGGDSHFIKTGLEVSQYKTLFWKFVGMVHGEAGYAESLDSNKPVPLNERFWLGGMHSVRGYKYGDISPKDEAGYEYGGDKYLLFNVEGIFPLSQDLNLKGVVFFDAGQVWDDDESYLSSDLKKAVGFGLRWFSPMGPLRLEYGFKLDKEGGESPGRWDFSVGGMF